MSQMRMVVCRGREYHQDELVRDGRTAMAEADAVLVVRAKGVHHRLPLVPSRQHYSALSAWTRRRPRHIKGKALGWLAIVPLSPAWLSRGAARNARPNINERHIGTLAVG
jgi:hypothetical protein